MIRIDKEEELIVSIINKHLPFNWFDSPARKDQIFFVVAGVLDMKEADMEICERRSRDDVAFMYGIKHDTVQDKYTRQLYPYTGPTKKGDKIYWFRKKLELIREDYKRAKQTKIRGKKKQVVINIAQKNLELG